MKLHLRRLPHASEARSVAMSHVGRVRTVNEDRVFDRADRHLWAVADGMGGHSAGDVAATIAVDELAALVAGSEPIDKRAVLLAIRTANARIFEVAGSDASGTTIVALLVEGHRATIFWVGDSRAGLLRDRALTALTQDHSLVAEWVEAGLLTERQAMDHPRANVITRALGIAPEVEIGTRTVELRSGDRILLSSDGLHRSLDPRDIAGDLALNTLAAQLLANALQRDGSDNASLVLVEF